MKFLCDSCKAKYQIADEKVAGKTVRMKCRKCGHQIEVRAAVTETSVASAPPRPPASPSAPRPPMKSGLATSLSAAKPRAPSAAPGGALAGAFKSNVHDAPASAPGDRPSASIELSVTDEWYVAINGVPVGPVRISELRRKAAGGAVT
ncbi:MAG: zinc-ribbon domain-containing protein, partial [Labilithrix sp.]|nr:zinc-ribbon domain-containing protein [Labilithrix sp.]